MPRATPDYEPIVVMNEALGGLFSSRINLNLREEHGYTYGASSQFVFRRSRRARSWCATGVRTDVTAPAVSRDHERAQAHPRERIVSPEELTLAKDSLVRSLAGRLRDERRADGTTANIYIYDLGLDYYAKLARTAGGRHGDQVKAVAQKYVVPEKTDRGGGRRSREDRRRARGS